MASTGGRAILTGADIAELTALRRDLHRRPEVSGEERETAALVVAALQGCAPDRVLTGLGGHGVAAVFDSGLPGETVMVRCELDGLPIEEVTDVAWRSEVPGTGHLCGHDGHMVMVLGLARMLARHRPAKGRVVLLFQPSEEDGRGARAVCADPAFAAIAPDWAFAIHNLPGLPLGHVATRDGLINCASQGVRIVLRGKTAHAATPETGHSPALAVARLVPALDALGEGGALGPAFRLATVTHLRVGDPTFGIAPGEAVVHVTLRAGEDAALAEMVAAARDLAVAEAGDLLVEVTDCDVFAASVNDGDAVVVARAAMDAMGVSHDAEGVPMRASEDFGVFGQHAKAAMLCLGSGVAQPALHNPDFDFPDALIPVGVRIFAGIVEDLLGMQR